MDNSARVTDTVMCAEFLDIAANDVCVVNVAAVVEKYTRGRSRSVSLESFPQM